MVWTLYCLIDSKKRIYYGQSKHVKQRWVEHVKSKYGVVREMLFNKKGKCKYCGVEMIDRNLNRHYNSCKGIVNKYFEK